MIFVSGANGQFARAVIRNVLADAPASSLVVGSRNVGTAFARELAALGAQVRSADFDRPDLMRGALEGVTKALLIPTYDTNDKRLRQNLHALEPGQPAGVRHLLHASRLRAQSQRVESTLRVHVPTEKAIREAGLGFTILRHALYADIPVGDLQE